MITHYLKYYVFEDGSVMHEDDFINKGKPLTGVVSIHHVPDEVFKHIHNNAVSSCCNVMETIFILKN